MSSKLRKKNYGAMAPNKSDLKEHKQNSYQNILQLTKIGKLG